MASLDSFKCRKTLTVGAKTYEIYSLKAAEKNGLVGVSQLPFSLKIVLENLLRNEDGRTVKKEDIEAVAAWVENRGKAEHEIAFRPARVLMQDFTGVPAVVDLAAMRDAMVALNGDPEKINPLVPVDLVIDHSVVVDYFGTGKSLGQNVAREYEQNQERYRFLKWGQQGFSNFRVVPPGTGICHQVNLEYLAQTVWTAKEKRNGKTVEVAFPDTLVGTDSHTTMVNGLAVLGWGVGGIEAEAAMLGQPLSMLLPEVIGFKLDGELREGVTATDLVLTVTQMLRKKGVVGKFVEFYGAGLNAMTVADRATIANMAPEYGATCGLFPIDAQTLTYLKTTSRKPARLALVEAYAKAQGAFRTRSTPDPVYSDTLALNLGEVTASLAGPKRPQDRVVLTEAKAGFAAAMTNEFRQGETIAERHKVEGTNYDLGHGDVVIAAITSCTNTSNPSVMMAAGLLARNAVAKGLTRQAVGQDVARAGQPGGPGLPQGSRPAEAARQARLQHRRLRLHHLHRQFRPACARDFGDHRQAQPRRGGSSVRQPQLRGPGQPGRACELSRFSAPRCRLFLGRLDASRFDPRSARRRQAGQACLPRRHLAQGGRDRGIRRRDHLRENVQDQICERVRWRRQLAEGESACGPNLRLGYRLDLCTGAALFRGADEDAGSSGRYRERPHPGTIPRIRSRPTTFRPRVRSRLRVRPGSISSNIRCARSTSTSMAPGGATMR